jgi:SAM-dependent methyltransferase
MQKIFDAAAVAQKQARARRSGGERFLEDAAAAGVAERLAAVTRDFSRALLVGDRVPPLLIPLAKQWECAAFDTAERLPVDGSFDLAVSLYSLQGISDLPGALIQIRRALKPDGLFLGAILGGDTLVELRQAFAYAESELAGGISPRVSPFADVRDLGGLLQRAGFALPVADSEKLMVRYADFFRLARDMRAHGLANSLTGRARGGMGRALLAAMLEQYHRLHGQDGKLKAGFETVYLTGWAPHESQQQPLKPGSASARLADALGTAEQVISGRRTPN